MPINRQKAGGKVAQARAYGREHKLNFFVAHHIMKAAMLADGIAPRGEHSEVPAEGELTAEDRAALAAARSALGLGG